MASAYLGNQEKNVKTWYFLSFQNIWKIFIFYRKKTYEWSILDLSIESSTSQTVTTEKFRVCQWVQVQGIGFINVPLNKAFIRKRERNKGQREVFLFFEVRLIF